MRIVSYRLAPAMLQHLWGQNRFSVREPSLSILNDPLYQEKKSSILSPEALLPSSRLSSKAIMVKRMLASAGSIFNAS